MIWIIGYFIIAFIVYWYVLPYLVANYNYSQNDPHIFVSVCWLPALILGIVMFGFVFPLCLGIEKIQDTTKNIFQNRVDKFKKEK